MARYGRNSRDPRVTLVRAHSYLTDNAIIDEYGPKIGAHGLAVYHALNRFADRQTGICWPKIKTIGARILLSESSIKRALHTLKKVGLIKGTGQNRVILHVNSPNELQSRELL